MVAVLPFFSVMILPAMTIYGLIHGGWTLWITLVFAFAGVAILEFVFGESRERIEITKAGEVLADLLLWGYVPLQFAILCFAAFRAPEIIANEGWGWSFVGMITSVGVINGAIGITYAHELVHRREPWSYWSGVTLLAMVSYGHFAIEHVLGHHSHVCTDQDGATARKGESSWRFLFRSIGWGFVSAWRIERTRLTRLKKPIWSPANRFLQVTLFAFVFASICFALGGVPALVLFFAQSVVAVMMLEFINYVEHYGLKRKILENGKPEPQQLWHSWDSHSRLSAWFLIHLARHAEHHKYPARPFTKLEGSLSSPMLPTGYVGSLLLAMIPPLWYRVMDPRIPRPSEGQKNEELEPRTP